MKTFSLKIAGFMILGLSLHLYASSKNSKIPNKVTDIQYAKFEYTAPNLKDFRHTLSDGSHIYLYPNHELPLIHLQFQWIEPNIPQDTTQVAKLSLLSSMLRRGGTKDLTPAQVDDSLEFLSAYTGMGLGNFSSQLSFDVLSKDLDKVLPLGINLIRSPRLDTARLRLQKQRFVQSIRHKYDRPGNLLSDLYSHLVYGNQPLNWSATEKEVLNVQQKDLFPLLPGRFSRGRLVIGASGDFNPDSLIQKIELVLQLKNKKKQSAQVTFPKVKVKMKPGIFIADKAVSQASIRLGQPFVQRPHPDYYPATVASYILGAGGFTSRLPLKIRSDEGLAYTVYSFTGSSYLYPKTSGVFLQTKVRSAAFALQLCMQEIRRILKDGITDEELQRAKTGLVGSLPGIFDTPNNTIDRFVSADAWGRTDDHFQLYPKRIQAVTKKDVMRVLHKYFSPEKMTIAIVGPAKELLKEDKIHHISLKKLGKIQILSEEEISQR